MIFWILKQLNIKNQKIKLKSEKYGPLDESQNALVNRFNGSGTLCILWSFLKITPNRFLIIKSDLKFGALDEVWLMEVIRSKGSQSARMIKQTHWIEFKKITCHAFIGWSTTCRSSSTSGRPRLGFLKL